jgi:hypothetical protein
MVPGTAWRKMATKAHQAVSLGKSARHRPKASLMSLRSVSVEPEIAEDTSGE